MGKKELQRYSLRKSSLGAASVLLGTAVIAVGASNASADEVATTTDSSTPAVKATDAVEESTATVADSTDKKVVNVTEEGNTTVTTSEVTNTSLETAKTVATNEGIEVKEETAQTKDTVEAAAADNKAQAEKINSVVSDYKVAKEQYKSDKADYDKAKANYDAKLTEKALAEKSNTEAQEKYNTEKAAYDKAQEQYQIAKQAYDSALSEYKTKKVIYDAKVAEKEAADKENALSAAKYQAELATYNQAKADYEAALAQYKSDKAKYNAEKANYDKKVTEKVVTEKRNAEAEAKYQNELAAYKEAKAKYDVEKAAYDKNIELYKTKKAAYEVDLETKKAIEKYNADAKAKYEAALVVYNEQKAKYDQEYLDYQNKLTVYQTALKQYQEAKAAYDKYMEDPVYRNLKDAEVVQELTFHRETEATHKLEGVSNYLTKAAQERLNTSNVFQYDSNKLQASDIVTDSPWTNTEDEWIQVKEGDKFVVTYDGLNQSSMLVKNEASPIKRVVYRYEIVSLPSNDGKGIAKISKDPTVTMTVGASTDQAKPVKVAVDVEFYDKDGKMFNLNEHNAVVALNSLNHWNGAAYVETSERPRPITVEAKDVNGNTVRGTYNPYADGSTLAIQNGEVVTKSGYADFGGATVNISADNPLKVVVPITDWNGSEWFVSREIPSDVTTLNASGSGNGHALGNQDYTFGDKDDVIGTYSVSAETGLITFTPKKKYQSTRHQEYVNIGDNQFIAIPKSSVTYDAATKEVTSVNDNQYIDHGSVYNGETTSDLTGWDNEDSPYLYYGGAGIKMTNGHLVFTADGANADGAPTVYWFAINSNLGLPKNPGEKPEEPKAPTPPTAPTKPLMKTVGINPQEPTPPTPPKEPVAPTPPTPEVVEVPGKPQEPTPPTGPVVPTPPTPKVVEVPAKPVEPTPPTGPVAPTPPTPKVVEVPAKPVEPKTPEKPTVVWHKNYVVERVSHVVPPTPKTPQKPVTPPTTPTPDTEVPVVAQPELPQTGEHTSNAGFLGLLSMIFAAFIGFFKRHKED